MAGLNDLFDAATAKKLKARGLMPSGVDKIEFLPTGIFYLDWALGGGLARKRITEIAGWAGSGKTTTALIIAQHTIEQGGRVAWFEAEEALDVNWVTELGIPYEEIYWDENDSLLDTHFHIFHPPYLERGLEDIRLIAPTGVYDLIIYDSIGGSPTLAAYEAEIEKNQMMQTARVLSRFCAVMPQDIKRGNSAVLFTNQVYDNPAQTYADALKPHGGSIIAKGGQGMAFLSTARMMTYAPKIVKNTADENVGKQVKVRVYKNKVLGGIQRDATYNIMHDSGYYIDHLQDILDVGNIFDILGKAGAWYTYQGQSIHGDAKFKTTMKDNPELTMTIMADLQEHIRGIRDSKQPLKSNIDLPIVETFNVEAEAAEVAKWMKENHENVQNSSNSQSGLL